MVVIALWCFLCKRASLSGSLEVTFSYFSNFFLNFLNIIYFLNLFLGIMTLKPGEAALTHLSLQKNGPSPCDSATLLDSPYHGGPLSSPITLPCFLFLSKIHFYFSKMEIFFFLKWTFFLNQEIGIWWNFFFRFWQ